MVGTHIGTKEILLKQRSIFWGRSLIGRAPALQAGD